MPITTAWHNDENTVIIFHYTGNWSWDEHYAAIEQSKVMVTAVPHEHIDMIAIMEGSFMPRGSSSVHTESILKHRASKLGIIVIISQSRFIETMFNVSRKVIKKMAETYHFARSMEDAEKIIARVRAEREPQAETLPA
jgi:hypothetical protein